MKLSALRPGVAIVLATCLAVAIVATAGVTGMPPYGAKHAADVQRGRYLVLIGQCNDCHTQGYAEAAGKVDEKLWLTGNTMGFRGPWGTTYPANLRLVPQSVTESQWPAYAKSEWRPPMPWFNVRAMSDADLIAIYRYLAYLGPAGEAAPSYLPPGQKPAAPVVDFPVPPK